MTNTRDTADHINEVPTIEADIASNTAATALNTTAVAQGNNHGKNLIINGDFSVWQRGTSQTSSGYGADDRWVNEDNGSTKVASQQTHTLGQTDVPGNPEFYSRTVVTSVAGASNFVLKLQKLERVALTAGREITLSFWAKADAAKNIAVEFAQTFGTGGSPSSAVTNIGTTTKSLTTSWARYTVTVTLPSISGKTLGTNGDDSLNITFWMDAGSALDARTNSLGQQSGTFDISNVQLEFGDTATEFEYVSPADQLARCQRYFERFSSSTDEVVLGGGTTIDTTRAWISCRYLQKRAAPTVTYSGTFEVLNRNVNITGSLTATNDQGTKGCYVTFERTSGTFTVGDGAIGRVDAGASNYLDIDAEL